MGMGEGTSLHPNDREKKQSSLLKRQENIAVKHARNVYTLEC